MMCAFYLDGTDKVPSRKTAPIHPHSFLCIQLLSEHFYVLGSSPGAENVAVNKVPTLMELTVWRRKLENRQKSCRGSHGDNSYRRKQGGKGVKRSGMSGDYFRWSRQETSLRGEGSEVIDMREKNIPGRGNTTPKQKYKVLCLPKPSPTGLWPSPPPISLPITGNLR